MEAESHRQIVKRYIAQLERMSAELHEGVSQARMHQIVKHNTDLLLYFLTEEDKRNEHKDNSDVDAGKGPIQPGDSPTDSGATAVGSGG